MGRAAWNCIAALALLSGALASDSGPGRVFLDPAQLLLPHKLTDDQDSFLQDCKILYEEIRSGTTAGEYRLFPQILALGSVDGFLRSLATDGDQDPPEKHETVNLRDLMTRDLTDGERSLVQSRYRNGQFLAPALSYAMLRAAERGDADAFLLYGKVGVRAFSHALDPAGMHRAWFLPTWLRIRQNGQLPPAALRQVVLFAKGDMRAIQADSPLPIVNTGVNGQGVAAHHSLSRRSLADMLMFETLEALTSDEPFEERFRQNITPFLDDGRVVWRLEFLEPENGEPRYRLAFDEPQAFFAVFNGTDVDFSADLRRRYNPATHTMEPMEP